MKNDFYATPGHVTRAILPHLPTHGKILEPCAGSGAIVHEVLRHGVMAEDIVAVEIDPLFSRRAGCGVARVKTADFLTLERHDFAAGWFDLGLVIANPPFLHAMAFLKKSLELAKPTNATVAFLLRLAWLETAKRAQFHRDNPCDVFVLSNRPSFSGDGATDSAAYGWFLYGPGRGNRWQILDTPEATS